MDTDDKNNLKLGTFVLLGLILLVVSLFYVGNRNSLFSSGIQLKARFSNINGLQQGSNVLYSGVNAGTVKSIKLLNSRTIEVTLLMKKEIVSKIPVNSKIAIGTDGLMGNKLLNITPARINADMVKDGDYLLVEKTVSIDEILTTLSRSNENIYIVSESLKNLTSRLEQSETLNLLEKKELSENLQASLSNIRTTTENAKKFTLTLKEIANDIHSGKGAAGLLLTNKAFSDDLQTTLSNLKETTASINEASVQINLLSTGLNSSLQEGKGPIPALLKDSLLTKKINLSLDNIEKSTHNFNQNMEAIKQSFLFRGYFKKQDKKNKEKNN